MYGRGIEWEHPAHLRGARDFESRTDLPPAGHVFLPLKVVGRVCCSIDACTSPRIPVSSENKSRRTPAVERPPMSNTVVARAPSVPAEPNAQAECISLAAGTPPTPPGRSTLGSVSNDWHDTLRQVKLDRVDKSIVKTSFVCPSGEAPPIITMVSPSSTETCELRGGMLAQGRETHSMHPSDPEQSSDFVGKEGIGRAS